MSTRSFIGKEGPDGSIVYVYCHSDGYPEHHGPLLLTNYTTPEAVDLLLAGGDLSMLVSTLSASFYYVRDRGDGTGPYEAASRAEYLGEMAESSVWYAYLFNRAHEWLVAYRHDDQFSRLEARADVKEAMA